MPDRAVDIDGQLNQRFCSGWYFSIDESRVLPLDPPTAYRKRLTTVRPAAMRLLFILAMDIHSLVDGSKLNSGKIFCYLKNMQQHGVM